MAMTPQEHLLAAADDMSEHGHTKSTFFRPEPGQADWTKHASCAMGSIARVDRENLVNMRGDIYMGVDSDIESCSATALLADQIRRSGVLLEILASKQWGSSFNLLTKVADFQTVSLFNDFERTTKEDVVLMMKGAASR